MGNLFLCSYFNAVADRFKEFAKGRKRVCFVATAAKIEEINFYVTEAREALVKLGFEVYDIDVAKCSKAEFVELLGSCDILYFSGGNTFYLMDCINNLEVRDEIKKFLKNNGLYVGESAGAMITAKDIKYVSLMDENSVQMTDFTALGLIDFYVLPHYGEEFFSEICEKILVDFKNLALKPISNSEFITTNFCD